MQSQVWVKRFDMWHDYMNLGQLLEIICERRQGNNKNTEAPKKPPSASASASAAGWPWSQTFRREDSGNSTDSRPVSSLSDISARGGTSSAFCRFCRQNGETAKVYRSHNLKSSDGKVTCPILWSYTCPLCEATGDFAHTRRYYPLAQRLDVSELPGFKFW